MQHFGRNEDAGQVHPVPKRGPKRRRRIRSSVAASSSSPISPEGKEGTCLIINYLRPSHEKAIAITSRSRGQRRYRRGLRLLSFLPSSLRSFVRSYVRPFVHLSLAPLRDLFRTCTRMKNNARIGEVCHRAAALFIFARRNTHLGTTLRRAASRSGLVREMRYD